MTPAEFEAAVAEIDATCDDAHKRIREAKAAIAGRDPSAYREAIDRAAYDLRSARKTLGDIDQ